MNLREKTEVFESSSKKPPLTLLSYSRLPLGPKFFFRIDEKTKTLRLFNDLER